MSAIPRIVFLSDSCLLQTVWPLAAYLDETARNTGSQDRVQMLLRSARAEYARGTDPCAVAAGLLDLLRHTDRSAAAGIGWLVAQGGRGIPIRLTKLLALHRLCGDEIVVVTELVEPCPAAGELDGLPFGVLGSHMPSDAMTGVRRVSAAEACATEMGSSLASSFAYGRAFTDLPLLRAVGVPVVVGTHPTLMRAVDDNGWRSLSESPLPAQTASQPASPSAVWRAVSRYHFEKTSTQGVRST